MRRAAVPAVRALLLALLLPAGSAGQIVRGQVVEEETASPVEGAMVLLLELDGSLVHRVLTDASGAFILDAAHPGAFLLRVDRIGYESLTTGRFDVPPEGTFRRVSVPLRPVELAGIQVEASRRCELRGEQGGATARVWEEARKALEAAAWTLESGAYRYTRLQYVRTLEPDGRTVRREDRRFDRSTGQAPYVSLDAEDLVEEGFVRANPDRTFSYYAPDAEAFLSDAFLDTHCMSLERGRDGGLGLAFEPVQGRRVPDIRGTLWLDAATARLRSLEFRYVNLPPDRAEGDAGGEVHFGRLPNGTWIVREWNIRMPLLTTNPQRTRFSLSGYHVQGGIVWRVVDRGGSTVAEAASTTVGGVVVDSLDARVVTGAVVEAEGTEAADTTREAGTFLLPVLPPGMHQLRVRHPSLDTLGLGPVVVGVDAAAGEVASVRVRLPGVTELLDDACVGTPEQDRETASVLVRIRRGRGPAAGEPVRVRWLGGDRRGFDVSDRATPPGGGGEGPRWTTDEADPRWLATTLDERGIFLLCGVPTRTQLRLEVGEPDRAAARTLDVPPYQDAVVVSVLLDPRREP